MCTQRLLACVVASCMLLCAVNGRLLELGDPRAGTDRAPLKVDRVTFQPAPDGRRILAETKPGSAPQEQSLVKQAQPSNSTTNQLQVGTAAVASGKSAAPTPLPAPAPAPVAAARNAAATPVAASNKAAAPAQPPAAANAKQQPAASAKPADAAAAPVAPKQGLARNAAAAGPRQSAATPAAQQKQPSATPPGMAHLAGKLSNAPNKNTDKVKQPDVRIEEMTLAELQKEDAPPSSCRWEPQTRGIKWNRGCSEKAIGASCNGIVLPGPPFCEGQGGSIATIKCLPDGEWGDVQTLC